MSFPVLRRLLAILSSRNTEEAWRSVAARDTLSDSEFLRLAKIAADNPDAKVILKLIRSYMSKYSRGIEAEKFYPSDSFKGSLMYVVHWPEFRDLDWIIELETALGITFDNDDLEQICPPSSPAKSGDLADFVIEILNSVRHVRETRERG